MTAFLLFWIVVLGLIIGAAVVIAKVKNRPQQIDPPKYKMWDTYTDITLYHLDRDRDNGDWDV